MSIEYALHIIKNLDNVNMPFPLCPRKWRRPIFACQMWVGTTFEKVFDQHNVAETGCPTERCRLQFVFEGVNHRAVIQEEAGEFNNLLRRVAILSGVTTLASEVVQNREIETTAPPVSQVGVHAVLKQHT
jgi:hypothetical protein